jgi:carboxyl-terminal processing protease
VWPRPEGFGPRRISPRFPFCNVFVLERTACMVKRIAFFALFLFGGLAGPAVRADDATGKPLVVVVGIDKYQDPQINARKHAEADAKALADLFLAKDRLGADPDRVKVLLGSGAGDQQATKDNILKALKWLEKTAAKDDLVILAFFGNGAPVGERASIFAVDSTYKDRAKDAVAAIDIEHAIDNLQSQRFLALLDVHFLGFDLGKEKMPDLNSRNILRAFLSQGDEEKDPQPSRVLFISGAASKPSLDLDKHGIFAQALLDGLNGKADADGYEGDGNIMVSELAKYMRKAVGDLARANGQTAEQRKQQGGILEAQTADFVVAYNPKAHAAALERLKKFAEIAAEQKLDKKIAEEGHNLLTRMPKREAQQNLRKAYQQLVDGKLDVAGFNTARAAIIDNMKLAEREATKYSVTVLKAADLVRRSYYKEVAKAPLIGHAIEGLFKSVDEKVPSDIKERIAGVKGMKDVELLRLLNDARIHLGKREDLDKGQDITYSLNALLGKLDKHSGYIPPEVVDRFQSDTEGSFRGIGVQIRRNEATDQLQVITPMYNSPAHKAGLKADDIITTIIAEVDPKTGRAYDEPKITPTKGMTTEDAVKIIKGKVGTRVKVLVEREGSDKPLEFTLVRNEVEVESVLGHKRNDKDAWNYVIDPENKICYVRLTGFTKKTFIDLEKVMKQLYKEGVKGFILDLRFNPGGLLDVSINIADLFIDDGLIVTIRKRDGTEDSYVGKSDGSYTSFPMVCLVNGGSASASEIVSACLQDHGRAIIMGSRSYGKGSVQTPMRFDNQSILKLTTATFWRPNGKNLHKASTKGLDSDEWGVSPNKGFAINLSKKEDNDLFDYLREAEIIRVKGAKPPPEFADFRDRQLDMALQYLRGQIQTASRKDIKRDIENR